MTHGARVRRDILDAGLRLWSKGVDPSAAKIASELMMTHQAVMYHFNSAYRLREALAAYAVQSGCSEVIVQLIGMRHESVKGLTPLERQAHFKTCTDYIGL